MPLIKISPEMLARVGATSPDDYEAKLSEFIAGIEKPKVIAQPFAAPAAPVAAQPFTAADFKSMFTETMTASMPEIIKASTSAANKLVTDAIGKAGAVEAVGAGQVAEQAATEKATEAKARDLLIAGDYQAAWGASEKLRKDFLSFDGMCAFHRMTSPSPLTGFTQARVSIREDHAAAARAISEGTLQNIGQ